MKRDIVRQYKVPSSYILACIDIVRKLDSQRINSSFPSTCSRLTSLTYNTDCFYFLIECHRNAYFLITHV